MNMLPVCSSQCQIPLHGGTQHCFNSLRRDPGARFLVENNLYSGLSIGKDRAAFKVQATKIPFPSMTAENNLEQSVWTSSVGPTSEQHNMERAHLEFVESVSMSSVEERLDELVENSSNGATTLLQPVEPESISSIGGTLDNPDLASEPPSIDNDSLNTLNTDIQDSLTGINDSINASLTDGQATLKNSLDSLNASISLIIKNVTEGIDNGKGTLFSNIDQVGASASDKLTNISSDLKEAANKATLVSIDVLRRAIVVLEDNVAKGASFVVYSYGSAKELLPPEIRDTLNTSEEKINGITMPVGVAINQVYAAIEGLERNLGLDPSDPIVSFVLFVGTASTLWAFYWVWTYGGYSGDFSPKQTLELLMGKENAVLVDVRPEVLREKDGVPDLRRTARFRYSSVSLTEVSGSTTKLLKSGGDLEDSIIAVVIRNLKTVRDRSKVIVMDVDGTRAKGIARSLRKLGIQRSYLVQGGFKSWGKDGLRIKELKPETVLTVLNEEAEAILEETSPLQVFGYGVGLMTVVYALTVWEKTLQFIGVLGIFQTIYRRLTSYENSEDFKQDLSLVLVPFKLGAEAFAWAAGKLETNGSGLPTSPSSSDVQNRVLQAAARHESQPSDDEAIQNLSTESVVAGNEGGEFSEA